jgi:hypothetical protein
MKGWYWHVHHKALVEYCYDVEGRHEYIKNNKPEHEVETRLKWMTPVLGELPKEVVAAGDAYNKALDVHHKALDVYYKTGVYREGGYYGVRDACDKTRDAYGKALKTHKDEIEALHAKEHPGCPWDGKTLFPKR